MLEHRHTSAIRGRARVLVVIIACAAACSLAAVRSSAQDASSDEAQAATRPERALPKLRVGYAGAEPFVIAGDPPQGISLDVWHTVARTASIDYELVERPSVHEALEALVKGQLDIVVGPISITAERARGMRFTQPYYQSQLGFLAHQGQGDFLGRVRPFLTRIFAGASLVLISSLLLIGTLIWLAERRRNPSHFPPSVLHGIGNGMWFALVTMTTVGYGDRSPVTLPGRMIAGLWMLIAVVTTTSLTAGVASAFTVLQLGEPSVQSAADLHDRPVVVVAGSTGAAFAAAHGARLIKTADVQSAVAALAQGKGLALIHDRPILQYHLAQDPSSQLKLAALSFEPQGYGFAVTKALDIVPGLDVALLEAQERGLVERATSQWLADLER